MAGADFVGVGENGFVGFEDFHVVGGVAVKVLGDFGERVAGGNGVGAGGSATNGGSSGFGGGRSVDSDVNGDVVRCGIDQLDLIPDFVFDFFRGAGALKKEFVVLDMFVAQADALLVHEIEDGSVFLFELFEVSHWFSPFVRGGAGGGVL